MKRRTREKLETILLCVLENHQDYIASEDVDALSEQDASKIIDWALTMVYEASDNPCRARYAPRCLRELLPDDHYLQTWRMPGKRQGKGS